MTKPLYRELAQLVDAYIRCQTGNESQLGWVEKHRQTIEALVKDRMPSGSGIDQGTHIDLGESKADRLVFRFGYHHMSESGMYNGWTEHKAIVTPSLIFGFELRITGPNRNDIKEYLAEVYNSALSEPAQEETLGLIS